MNTPPHVGLHASDPFMAPPMQIGRVVSGSPTVMIGGKPAATADVHLHLLRDAGHARADRRQRADRLGGSARP